MSLFSSKIYELVGPKTLKLKEEIIDSSYLNDGEFIAKTIFSAVSPGTEVGAYAGLEPLRPGNIYPRVLGYCNVSQIVHPGKGLKKFKEGDYILTLQSHRDAFKLNENDFAVKLPEKINLKHAATAYLYHLGYHSLITANLKAGHNTGIIGAGVLGITTYVMSKIAGSKSFVFTNQAEVAKLFQKEDNIFLRKTDESIETIFTQTLGTGLDIVINTSNSWDDWLLALKLVNRGGTIVNVGFPGRSQELPTFNPLDPQYVYAKNISIKALCYLGTSDSPYFENRFTIKRNLEFILSLIANHQVDPDLIVSREINYLQLGELYDNYLDRKKTMFTSIINWL